MQDLRALLARRATKDLLGTKERLGTKDQLVILVLKIVII
jgi:hypothetical protein